MSTSNPKTSAREFAKARADFMSRVSAPDIPATALKLAYLIAFKYLNRHTGSTFVAQETLAADLATSVRTVQRLLLVRSASPSSPATVAARPAPIASGPPVRAKRRHRCHPLAPRKGRHR
jgi:hypothetical protein